MVFREYNFDTRTNEFLALKRSQLFLIYHRSIRWMHNYQRHRTKVPLGALRARARTHLSPKRIRNERSNKVESNNATEPNNRKMPWKMSHIRKASESARGDIATMAFVCSDLDRCCQKNGTDSIEKKNCF